MVFLDDGDIFHLADGGGASPEVLVVGEEGGDLSGAVEDFGGVAAVDGDGGIEHGEDDIGVAVGVGVEEEAGLLFDVGCCGVGRWSADQNCAQDGDGSGKESHEFGLLRMDTGAKGNRFRSRWMPGSRTRKANRQGQELAA